MRVAHGKTSSVKNECVRLIPLRAPIANGALTAAALPTRLKILGWGDNPSVKGNARFSEHSAATLPARQQETGFNKIALDFEHNTVPGSPEFERTNEPRRVAAYGVPTVIPGDGLYLEALEWTPSGKAEALNYADLSPAVEFDAAGNIVFVHSVALTRNGAVEGLSFFSVNLPNQKAMSELKPENILTVAELAPAIGLAATASKADVLGKLTALSALDLAPLDARLKQLEGRAAPDITTFNTRLAKLEGDLTATATASADRERDQLIVRFSADGKVPVNAEGQSYSADDLKKLDVPTLKLLHANTPVTVPLQARGKRPPETTEAATTAHGFKNLVTLHVSAGKTRSQAIDLAISENPEAYKAWRAANGQPGL